MPREDRRIIFDFAETYKALHNLSLKQNEAPKMIAGLISKVEQSEDNPKNLNVYLKNPQTGESKVMVYSKDYMAAALVMYCRGLGIPLPRKAIKSIVLDGNAVILRALVG